MYKIYFVRQVVHLSVWGALGYIWIFANHHFLCTELQRCWVLKIGVELCRILEPVIYMVNNLSSRRWFTAHPAPHLVCVSPRVHVCLTLCFQRCTKVIMDSCRHMQPVASRSGSVCRKIVMSSETGRWMWVASRGRRAESSGMIAWCTLLVFWCEDPARLPWKE